MKAAELRDLGVDELGAKERDLVDQLFRMRIQKSMGQLEAPLVPRPRLLGHDQQRREAPH